MKLFILAILLVFSINITASTQINLLPKYGGIKKNKEQEKVDREFIRVMEEKYKDLKVASSLVANSAWEFYEKNQDNEAMKRFNQAWLLDSNNITLIFGFQLLSGKGNDSYISVIDSMDNFYKQNLSNLNFINNLCFVLQSIKLRLEFNGIAPKIDFHKKSDYYFSNIENSYNDKTELYLTWVRGLLLQGRYQDALDKLKLIKEEDLSSKQKQLFQSYKIRAEFKAKDGK